VVFRFSLLDVCVIVMVMGVLAGLPTSVLVSSIDFDMTHRYPPATSNPGGTNLESIAGDCYWGDGLGIRKNLSILINARDSLIDSGCTGVNQRESGCVRRTDGPYWKAGRTTIRPPGTGELETKYVASA